MIKKKEYTGSKTSEIQEYERKHRAVARKAAAQGITLLKNDDHILPLKKGSKVALYGAGAVQTQKGGIGSGDVNDRGTVSIYDGMRNSGFQIANEEYLESFLKEYWDARYLWRDTILTELNGGSLADFFRIHASHPFEYPGGRIPNAEEILTTGCHVACYVISRSMGENADRRPVKGDYYLTDEEKAAIDGVCKCYRDVILILNIGAPIDLSFIDTHENIKAILYMGLAGMEAGNALADVIGGNVPAGGRLTDTWVKRYEDYPNAQDFAYLNGDIHKELYREGIYVGYRYFDTFDIPVRYPFGYGLSYTEFDIKTESILVNNEVCLVIRVTNEGITYSSRETVQIYASCPQEKMRKEFRRLVGFAKTGLLAPGDSETISIRMSPDLFASFCTGTSEWVLEKGRYALWVGSDISNAKPAASFMMPEDVVLSKTERVCPLKQELQELQSNPEMMIAKWRDLDAKLAKLPYVVADSTTIIRETVDHGREEAEPEELCKKLAKELTIEQCIRMVTNDSSAKGSSEIEAAADSVPGAAGETSACASDMEIPGIVMADGPAGLRLLQHYNVVNGKKICGNFKDQVEHGLFEENWKPEGDTYYQFCTAFPVASVLAMSWDLELLREVGAAVAEEMDLFRVSLWLAPGMNIHRNPLCGRNYEYYSEDPLLAGLFASAVTMGVQSLNGTGTTIKHFAANNQETNRKGVDAVVGERALREIYLRGFEIAVKSAQPMALMTSYNLLNGEHTANSYDLCTRVAREEWGFAGVIMTDWNTTAPMPEGYNRCSSAAMCIKCGNDLVCPGKEYDREDIRKALKRGTLTEEELRRCVSKVIDIALHSNMNVGAVSYTDRFHNMKKYLMTETRV